MEDQKPPVTPAEQSAEEERKRKQREATARSRAKKKAERDGSFENVKKEQRSREEIEASILYELRMERVRSIVSVLASPPPADEDMEYLESLVDSAEQYLTQFNGNDFTERYFYELFDAAIVYSLEAGGPAITPLPRLPEPSQWFEGTRLAGRMGPVYSAYESLRRRVAERGTT